jgi:hypothetical protein
MIVKLTKWSLNLPTFSIARPSKIYPNFDFSFDKKPSGNPAVVDTNSAMLKTKMNRGFQRNLQNLFFL